MKLRYVIVIFGSLVLLLVLFLMQEQYKVSLHAQQSAKEANVYSRTTSCILSVPLATRTDEYISECYNKAEKANDIKVDRFGNK